MRVMLTGGTGYVGSWAAVALLERGHDVRLLARHPDRVAATFAPHGRAPTDVVAGDVLDADAVRRAVDGCDAVVHAAAVYSIDPRRAAEVTDTNAAATRLVLDAAVEAGCDPVVHVSSTVAITRRGGSGPDLPLGDVELPYARSKIASERIARDLQEQGRPVVTVYPGGVYGPHDPYLGDQAHRLVWVVRGWLPMWPRGSMLLVDVREVAATIAACVEPGRGPRRYVVPGHQVDGPRLFDTVGQVIGRRRLHVPMPAALAVPSTRLVDAVQRHLPARWHCPADLEGVVLHLRDTDFDTGPAQRDLGITARPWEETVRDTIGWLVDAGHVPARYRPR